MTDDFFWRRFVDLGYQLFLPINIPEKLSLCEIKMSLNLADNMRVRPKDNRDYRGLMVLTLFELH